MPSLTEKLDSREWSTGDEPDGLSLEKLRKHLPVRWDEQRMLG